LHHGVYPSSAAIVAAIAARNLAFTSRNRYGDRSRLLRPMMDWIDDRPFYC
jgi:hypothetical protein